MLGFRAAPSSGRRNHWGRRLARMDRFPPGGLLLGGPPRARLRCVQGLMKKCAAVMMPDKSCSHLEIAALAEGARDSKEGADDDETLSLRAECRHIVGPGLIGVSVALNR